MTEWQMSALRGLRRPDTTAEIEAVYEASASQKGANLSVWMETDSGAVIGSDRAGKLGRRSEEIGRYVAESILEDLKTGATVDRYVADQLIPFCAVASGASEYVIPSVTEHVETNLWLVERILGAKTRLDGRHLRIEGVGERLRGEGGSGARRDGAAGCCRESEGVPRSLVLYPPRLGVWGLKGRTSEVSGCHGQLTLRPCHA